MKAVLERLGVFVASAVGAALVVGLATWVGAYEPLPDGAMRYEERYDERVFELSQSSVVGLSNLTKEVVDSTEYLGVDLAAPFPFGQVRLSVEGADAVPLMAQGTFPAGVDLRVQMPAAEWAGVVVEVQCAP